jgi:hypothetical protein
VVNDNGHGGVLGPVLDTTIRVGGLPTIGHDAYEWMKGLLRLLPDGNAAVRSFAVDEIRNNVAVFAEFRGTHTGEGGPVPATGKTAEGDYVYVMDFDGDKIRHMTRSGTTGSPCGSLGGA